MSKSSFAGKLFHFTIITASLGLLTASTIAQQGVQVNTDPSTGRNIVGDAGNEPTLAISLTDPNAIVVGWRLFPTINSDDRKAGFAYSHDGGLTFTAGGYLSQPPGWPSNTSQTDPVMGADSSGTFFYWSEPFRPDSAEWVYPSYNNGVVWGTPTPVKSPISGDKDWMAIDTTGGVGDGHIYGGWNDFSLGGQCFTRSTDNGASFSPRVRIADRGGTQWMLHFAVGPDGEVYAAWRNMSDNAIYVTKSTNAKFSGSTPTFDAFGSGGQNGLDLKIDNGNDPGFMNINPLGFHQIYLGVDTSGGVRNGWVYCLWADARRDMCDINFARSSDGGFTWESGIRVNDDPAGSYQWMPAMSVAPNGRIDAVWYDTRNSSGSTPDSQMYYSFSLDGGSTWSVNRRISDAFDTTKGYPQQDKIGDYIDSRSDNGGINFVYAATFTGGQDVWFMRSEPAVLTVNNLVAGQVAVFDVVGAAPNQVTALAYSLTGLGSTYISQLNAYLGIKNPVQAGPIKQTNTNGSVSWSLQVPMQAKNKTVWIQAIQKENGTNIVKNIVG